MTIMASILPGYEYDIFISYRQKDNKGDGWVSEFVEALKTELESTFKEEVSVYFDINPHDGLLETHDVDASLKEKLKCLVFIPIISRTYCDPKSFAWEHEFKVFIEQASQDQFGLKVKLPNGNVASRVLPIQIHDLKSEDKMLVEKELGGFIRAIEFIYKESGVNRPLTPKDSEDKNANKTNYRNQINKVANAIDEIISGLKAEPIITEKEKFQYNEPFAEARKEERKEVHVTPANSSKQKLLTGGIVLAVLLVIAAVFAYPKIFKRDILEKLRSSGERISVAVMPFQNMTNDTTWNIWQNGIQINMITYLSNNPDELQVRQAESVTDLLQGNGLINYASISPSLASKISQKLDADVFIHGSISQAGFTIRINAQLINSKTEEVFRSFQIEGPGSEDKIFYLIDSLSFMVKNFLLLDKLEKEVTIDYHKFATTNSPEAYRYYIKGEKAFKRSDFNTAINWYLQTIAIDSNFTDAFIMLSSAYQFQGMYDQAKKWALRLYKKREILPMYQKVYASWGYAHNFETLYEEIKYLEQLGELDDQIPFTYYLIGGNYRKLQQYDKAIPYFEKALEIYRKWDLKPWWIRYYTDLGRVYHKNGQYKREEKLYKKAAKDFPDDPDLVYRQAVWSLTVGEEGDANRYLEKYKSISKDNSLPETVITGDLANIYWEAGLLDQAEEYFLNALSSEPESPERMNNLSWFLIDTDRNINEGLDLVNRALESDPDNYSFLDCKGWGLYKQGKYEEALGILQKSWDIRREKAIYKHEAYLHLEAAKKAVAK